MVADDDAVRALYDGPDGVAAGIRAGSVAVDCSTVLPDAIRSVAGAVRARGAGILDAPGVGQRQLDRSPGELTIMVGGEAADLERAPADPRAPRATGLPPRPARAPARR